MLNYWSVELFKSIQCCSQLKKESIIILMKITKDCILVWTIFLKKRILHCIWCRLNFYLLSNNTDVGKSTKGWCRRSWIVQKHYALETLNIYIYIYDQIRWWICFLLILTIVLFSFLSIEEYLQKEYNGYKAWHLESTDNP